MRNELIYEFSGDIGMECVLEFEPCVVILNGKYHGMYQIGEHKRVDKDRIDVFDWEGLGDKAPAWSTPCALEQYSWHVPIDASTARFIHVFLNMYKAGCGEIYLAKARALADQITRVQHEDGKIPTHWMNTKGAEDNFWYNCMFYTCTILEEISEYEDVIFED